MHDRLSPLLFMVELNSFKLAGGHLVVFTSARGNIVTRMFSVIVRIGRATKKKWTVTPFILAQAFENKKEKRNAEWKPKRPPVPGTLA